MGAIHNPHDMLAKRFLTNLPVAIDFLKAHLPEKIKARCDFDSLQIEPTSYVEEDMRAQVTDILYSLKIDGHLGFIYIILEAQNTPLKLMPLRYLRYKTSIWKNAAEAHPNDPLPVIVPIMLYTGKKTPYPHSLDLMDCFEDPVFARAVFHAPIHLVDLTVIPDSEIIAHGKAALLETVQKHIRGRDILNLAYKIIGVLQLQEITRDLYQDLLKYIVSEGDGSDFKRFFQVLTQGAAQHKETAMSIAERLKNEAMLQERLTIAKNLLQRQVDVSLIKDTTGLSDRDLARLVKNG